MRMKFMHSCYGICLFVVFMVFPLKSRADDAPQPDIALVSAHAADANWQVHVQIFKPVGSGPFPLIVFSHGRSPKQPERLALKYPVLRGHVAYWLRKGFAVIAPIRPGYGETGGADIEESGIKIARSGECSGTPHYRVVAEAAADIVRDVVAWARHQTWVDPQKILLVGVSVGGITTVAAGARHLPGVIGYINFSGGEGGNPERLPDRSCFPEVISDLYREYGAKTHIPNLWLYAKNDEFWGPQEPVIWHNAFAKAGGLGQFIQTDPVPDAGGHSLLAKGGRLWGVHVDAFVQSLGFATPLQK